MSSGIGPCEVGRAFIGCKNMRERVEQRYLEGGARFVAKCIDYHSFTMHRVDGVAVIVGVCDAVIVGVCDAVIVGVCDAVRVGV